MIISCPTSHNIFALAAQSGSLVKRILPSSKQELSHQCPTHWAASQDSATPGTLCCVVEHIFHHHAGEHASASRMSSGDEQGVVAEERNKSHNQNTKWESEELDGLKTFIHSTADRLEETDQGILVGSHQGKKYSQGIGLEEDEEFICTIQSHTFSQTTIRPRFPFVLTEVVCGSQGKSHKDRLIFHPQGILSRSSSLNIFEFLSLFLLVSPGKTFTQRETANVLIYTNFTSFPSKIVLNVKSLVKIIMLSNTQNIRFILHPQCFVLVTL